MSFSEPNFGQQVISTLTVFGPCNRVRHIACTGEWAKVWSLRGRPDKCST